MKRWSKDGLGIVGIGAVACMACWGLEDTWTRMRQLAGDDITLRELGSLSDTKERRP